MTEAETAYKAIEEEIIPYTIEQFLAKAKDYSGGPAFLLLGSKGQFSDINRKFWKLYRAVWEGHALDGEQPGEIVTDFIGHCWLLLFCLIQEAPAEQRRDAMTYEEFFGIRRRG